MVSAKSELRRSANESLKEQQARMTQQASRGRKPAIEVAELAESFEFSRSGNGTESLCDFRYKAGAIELEPPGLRLRFRHIYCVRSSRRVKCSCVL